MTQYKTIAESNNFIVLDKYTKYSEVNEAPSTYQTEAALNKEITNQKPTTIRQLYDVFKTPTFYLLDKDKKIIAKQLTISQLEDFIDRMQNIKDAEKIFPPDPEEEAH